MQNVNEKYSMTLKPITIVGERRAIALAFLAIPMLCTLCGCGRGVEDRISRAYALGRRPSEPNKARIEALLVDEDRDVRATALVVMGSVDKARASRLAVGALIDPDGFVRATAVTLCAEGADAETVRAITALATDDPVWQVRTRALGALASSEDPAVREAFIRALSDSVRHVRRAALRAGIAHPGLLPVDLLNTLVVSDVDWENRVEASTALGASKDPAAYVGLDAALVDPNEFVRTTAVRERRALERAGVPRLTEIPQAGV
jgi:HEAT repeat protein